MYKRQTIDFGDRLSKLNKKVWIRFVMVPDLTDSMENVENVVKIVSRWKNNVERVEVLPFHNMGADKWHELGWPYTLEDTRPPKPEDVERVRNKFREEGFTVY